MDALSNLRTPWSLGALTLPHRVVMGSMHTGLETRDDGGEALAAFYRERARGGASLIVTGGLAVSSAARGGPDYAVLTRPEVQERFAVAVDAVHHDGGRMTAQLFHAGRYALMERLVDDAGRPEQAVAPSPVPWRAARGAVPRELSDEDVRGTIADFAAAATAAVTAGFDAVEIMASEGYLINQFCSPLTNLRDDEWGGDAERRNRFAIAVVTAVRAAVPSSVPVLVRMSGADLMPGSSSDDQVDALALALADAGADGLSVGIGWHESTIPTVQASVPHGMWLDYAERIATVVHVEHPAVPVIASNRITDLRDAEQVLRRGAVDAVALARPFLADPELVSRSFAGDFATVNACIGCDQACIDRSLVFQPVSCLVNPRAGRENELPLVIDPDPRRMAVVGGGPAGLAAAVDLVRRGHAVTLFDAADALGGQFGLAARVPGKEDYALTVSSARETLLAHGARLRLGHAPTIDDLSGFDGVVVATGVRPRTVNIPGSELPHVLSYEQALRDGVPAGTVAIVGGGGIGVDVATALVESHEESVRAHDFADRFGLEVRAVLADSPRRITRETPLTTRPGEQITLLRRSGKFGQGVGITSRWVVLGTLRDAGVRMHSELSYRAITPEGVEIERPDGTVELVPGETVVLCAGQVEHNPLAAELERAGVRFEVVGGARDARSVDAVRATTEGILAARRLTRSSGGLTTRAASMTE